MIRYNPYSHVPKNLLLMNGISEGVLGILILVISYLVLQKYLKVKSKALRNLFLTIVNIGVAFLCVSYSELICYTQYANTINPDPIVFGIPIFFIKDAYWPIFNMSYSFGVLSFIFMIHFSSTVFQKPGRLVLSVYNVLGILLIFYFNYYGIFIYGIQEQFSPDLSSIGSFGVIAFLMMGLIVYIPLLFVSYRTSKTQNEIIIKRGIQLIASSTLTIILYLLLLGINGVLVLNYDLIPLFFAFLATIQLYLGYVMPNWLVKRLDPSKKTLPA